MRDSEIERELARGVAELRAMESSTVPLPAPVMAVFEPDRMRAEMDRDLPKALRELADALESQAMRGRLSDLYPHGFSRDVVGGEEWAHMVVRLAIAAPVRRAVAE